MQGSSAPLYHDDLVSNNSVVTRFLPSSLTQQTGKGGGGIGCGAMLGMQRQQDRHSKTAAGSGGGSSSSGGGVGVGGEEGGDAAAKLRTACDHCSTKKIKVRYFYTYRILESKFGVLCESWSIPSVLHVDHVP